MGTAAATVERAGAGTTAVLYVRSTRERFARLLDVRILWWSERPEKSGLLSAEAIQFFDRLIMAARKRASTTGTLTVTFTERLDSLAVSTSYFPSPKADPDPRGDFGTPQDAQKGFGGALDVLFDHRGERVYAAAPLRDALTAEPAALPRGTHADSAGVLSRNPGPLPPGETHLPQSR